MTFLASLVAEVVKWLLEKLGAFIASTVSKMTKRKEIKDEAEESVKPLKDAKTPDEIDKATDSTLGGL